MIEVTVAVDVDTNDVSELMADWKDVDFVWQVSGEEDIVLVVDAADTAQSTTSSRKRVSWRRLMGTMTRLILDERVG